MGRVLVVDQAGQPYVWIVRLVTARNQVVLVQRCITSDRGQLAIFIILEGHALVGHGAAALAGLLQVAQPTSAS